MSAPFGGQRQAIWSPHFLRAIAQDRLSDAAQPVTVDEIDLEKRKAAASAARRSGFNGWDALKGVPYFSCWSGLYRLGGLEDVPYLATT
jgi:hypothetical protein